MVCVINPDGTITCSDGDDAAAKALVSSVSQSGAWDGRTMKGVSQAAAVLTQLSKSNSPMAVVLVDASALGWNTL